MRAFAEYYTGVSTRGGSGQRSQEDRLTQRAIVAWNLAVRAGTFESYTTDTTDVLLFVIVFIVVDFSIKVAQVGFRLALVACCFVSCLLVFWLYIPAPGRDRVVRLDLYLHNVCIEVDIGASGDMDDAAMAGSEGVPALGGGEQEHHACLPETMDALYHRCCNAEALALQLYIVCKFVLSWEATRPYFYGASTSTVLFSVYGPS